MSPILRCSLVLAVLCLVAVYTQAPGVHRRFEYKHSFKGPNIAQRDGKIPFWEIQGDAIASPEQLRLAPSIRSKKGGAWNTRQMVETEFWEVEITFKVTGQGRIGADGLAFWYTANKGALGNTFGSNAIFNGLGVFFDSFDNDAQKNNPYIMAMQNDGTKSYDHHTDGRDQQLGGCQRDFRNKPYPIRARVEYYNNVLTVFISDGMAAQARYEICLRVENVYLPRNGFFGMSAATGGLADDHDILAFTTTSLRPSDQVPVPQQQIPEDEQKKFEEEFDKYWKEFEEEKEKFKQQHPEKAQGDDVDYAKLYENAMDRQLRIIFEGQSQIHDLISKLETKLDSISQNQNYHTSLIQAIPKGGAAGQVPPPPPPGAGPQAGAGGGSGMQRNEVNEVMKLSREASAMLRELKTFVTDIHAKAQYLEQRAAAQPGAPPPAQGQAAAQAGGGISQQQFNTVKQYLDNIKKDTDHLRRNSGGGGGGGGCPDVSGLCLTRLVFFGAVAVQTLIIAVMWYFKRGSEKAKFY